MQKIGCKKNIYDFFEYLYHILTNVKIRQGILTVGIFFTEDVNSMGVRLRLYGCERMRRERLIGESVVSFANINLELENNFWLNLEPRSNTTMVKIFLNALGGCSNSGGKLLFKGT